MRARILTLPLMLAAVLTLVWRKVPSARELNRMLARENLLWAKKQLPYLSKHSRHRSPVNFGVNILCGLIAYCYQPKKPSLNLEKDLAKYS